MNVENFGGYLIQRILPKIAKFAKFDLRATYVGFKWLQILHRRFTSSPSGLYLIDHKLLIKDFESHYDSVIILDHLVYFIIVLV